MQTASDLCPRCHEVPSESFEVLGASIVALCDRCDLELQKQEAERLDPSASGDPLIASEIPELYRDNDESRFPAVWEQIKRWRPNPDGRGLVIVGDTGKCKTRMLCQLAINIRKEQNTRFRFLRASELSRLVRAQYNGFDSKAAKNAIESLRRASLLIIDDLGKQASSPAVEEEFFDIIEDRTSARKPVLVSANATGAELEQMMTPDRGRPLIRRIREFCDAYAIKK